VRRAGSSRVSAVALVDPETGRQATVTGIDTRGAVAEVLADRRDGLVIEYVTLDGEHAVPGVRVVLLDPATRRHRDLAYYQVDNSGRLFRLPGGGREGG
jgi:hypothetical protein